jgi:hypothetical protein
VSNTDIRTGIEYDYVEIERYIKNYFTEGYYNFHLVITEDKHPEYVKKI